VAVVVTGPLTVQALIDKLTARQAAADAEIADLRERMAELTDALVAAERERDRWAGTRETVLALAAEEHPDQAAATRPVTPAYQQILAAFTTAAGPLRAKELCQALEVGTESRHIEGVRSKLKKLTARGLLTEPSPGMFALTQTQARVTD
jgi:predicted  nucleic acid-binding Zn-ribbon protein